MRLTEDQQKVVETRNKDILVSAAAGSGKTAVLIQRILSRVTDANHPIDVDRLLIVTFTKAAAAEMRERLHKAILEALEKEPDNENLQRQATLIHNAQITTIDSFCQFILKNHFHEIGLDPAFRVADPGEVKLIEKQVLADTLEEFYAAGQEEFLDFADAYCPDGKDGRLEEMVEQLYHYSMSHPWPLEWLDMCKSSFHNLTEESICEMEWMQYGWQMMGSVICDCKKLAQINLDICEMPSGPYQYVEAIKSDIQEIEKAQQVAEGPLSAASLEALKDAVNGIEWKMLSRKSDPSVDTDLKDQVKSVRDRYKKLVKGLVEDYLADPFSYIVRKEQLAADKNSVLVDVTQRFITNLQQVKKEKNLIDFSDAEHFALDILCENGKPTDTALSYRDYFEEVMIDEYQDSNLVQELLLSSVARTAEGSHDRFMVGDMKQSIYRFRLACPKLFLDKYQEYQGEDAQNVLICLKKNFRSRSEVLDSVNDVFYKVMRQDVGDVSYDADAALYLGADYGGADQRYQTELCLLEGAKLKSQDARKAEALMIAKRIKELVGSFPVVDSEKAKLKKEGEPTPLRPATYRDIVILTRSETNVTPILRSVLMQEGIPVHITSKSGYFTAQEISTLMDLLRVINNPYEDIAFCSVMMSVFFGFSSQEIAQIRGAYKEEASLYGAFLCAVGEKVEADKEQTEATQQIETTLQTGETPSRVASVLQDKIKETLSTIRQLRQESIVHTMPELLQLILFRFHYLEYVTAMPAGQQRRANVEMFIEKTVDYEKTSFHGLFHFIRYMEQLKKYEVDFGEASILAETADVVRIMTIHKSKGLEFPICFVSGLERRFNLRDVSKSVLVDVDWGVASDYVDLENRVSGKTLRKNLLSERMKLESLGEELRVLYVAMTRAKEKLIMTGVVDDAEKTDEKYAFLRYDKTGGAIPSSLLATSNSFLDYLLMVMTIGTQHIRRVDYSLEAMGLTHLEADMQIDEKQAVLERMKSMQDLIDDQVQDDTDAGKQYREQADQLRQKLAFCYPYANLAGLGAKTSVSELKKAAMEEAGLHPTFETDVKGEPYYPAFAVRREEHGGTDRGSAYHRALEMLDFDYFGQLVQSGAEEGKILSELQAYLDHILEQGLISKEYLQLVSMKKLLGFLQSDIATRMSASQRKGGLKKEQPFVLSIEASRLDKKYPDDETVLIQGIIDVFFEEDGEIVILDYKTDRIADMPSLLNRYRTQLDYYEEAVERITGRKVKEKVLYSFAHMDSISWK